MVPHAGCLGSAHRPPEHSHAAEKQECSGPGVSLELYGGDRSVGTQDSPMQAEQSSFLPNFSSPFPLPALLFPLFSSLNAIHPKLSAPASLPLHPSLLPPLLSLSSYVPKLNEPRSFSSGVNPNENKLIIGGKVAPFSVPTPVSHLISLSASSILLLCACLLPLSGLCSG